MSRHRFLLLSLALVNIALIASVGCTPYYSTSSVAQTHLVSAAIQGDWEVDQGRIQQNREVVHEQVGTLTIDGASYKFRPLAGKNISDIDQAFQFLFSASVGEIEIKYETNIHANDKLEALERQTILATCTFKSGGTAFYTALIRVADEPTEIYLHSMINEMAHSVNQGATNIAKSEANKALPRRRTL